MHVTKFEDAVEYEAPKHFDMRALRLQGAPSARVLVGLSRFLPGGGAEMDLADTEKIYVVLSGSVRVSASGGTEQMLRVFDSCLIEAGETRAIDNPNDEVATMLVITFAADSGTEGKHAG